MAILAVLAGCKERTAGILVLVSNPTESVRDQETVSVSWEALLAVDSSIVPETVVVKDANGQEIPSQVVFRGMEKPQELIFQASLAANAAADFYIGKGIRSAYEPKVFGRLVPERKDDFAWENNKIAFRIYGPALEATGEISNGIDVWVKSTDKLVVNAWYKTDDYHRDHGEGLDCYKVGRTLGAGAMAPYVNGQLVLGNNFTHSEVLDNGPLRLTFRLAYAPYKVGENEVTETRTFTLDANTHFNQVEVTYENAPAGMEVAAGIVLREAPGELMLDTVAGAIGYWEPQNNDNDMDNGHTAVGVIFPGGATAMMEQDGHLLMTKAYSAPFVYYCGAGWSKGGVASVGEWFKTVAQAAFHVKEPLEVKLVSKK